VAAVSDELINVFAAAGRPDEVTARLKEFAKAEIRGLLAWYVFGPDLLVGIRQIAKEVAPLRHYRTRERGVIAERLAIRRLIWEPECTRTPQREVRLRDLASPRRNR
jgi:hypothetical protein